MAEGTTGPLQIPNGKAFLSYMENAGKEEYEKLQRG